jgi:hypothetical protein
MPAQKPGARDLPPHKSQVTPPPQPHGALGGGELATNVSSDDRWVPIHIGVTDPRCVKGFLGYIDGVEDCPHEPSVPHESRGSTPYPEEVGRVPPVKLALCPTTRRGSSSRHPRATRRSNGWRVVSFHWLVRRYAALALKSELEARPGGRKRRDGTAGSDGSGREQCHPLRVMRIDRFSLTLFISD